MATSTDIAVLRADISVDYAQKPGVLRHAEFQIFPGEVLGLAGTSGSGKSTIALSLLNLLHYKGGQASGEAWFNGENLLKLPERKMRALRGRDIALVLQSPLTSLNPAMRIGSQLQEAWCAHERGDGLPAIRASLESVSLPSDDAFLRRKPAQLSVGQAQRVLIAMAILHRPKLLIADEPTSALDLITQAEVLQLFSDLNQKMNMAMLFISHDLYSMAALCHRVAVLHEGVIVETGSTQQVFETPRHPYVQKLIAALPTTRNAKHPSSNIPANVRI